MEKTYKAKCKKCGYEWETRAKLYYITCSSCQTKSTKENLFEKKEASRK